MKEEVHDATVSPEDTSYQEPRATPSVVASLKIVVPSVVPCAQWVPVKLPASSYTCVASVVPLSRALPDSWHVQPSLVAQNCVQCKWVQLLCAICSICLHLVCIHLTGFPYSPVVFIIILSFSFCSQSFSDYYLDGKGESVPLFSRGKNPHSGEPHFYCYSWHAY